MTKIASLKRQWHTFRSGKPGSRFEDRFERNRKARASQSWLQRLVQPVIGILLIGVGVVLTFLPGPGVIFYFFGAGLLAGESRYLARALDWTEVRLRKLVRWMKRWWKQAPLVAKLAVIFVAASGAAGAGYLAYRFFFGK